MELDRENGLLSEATEDRDVQTQDVGQKETPPRSIPVEPDEKSRESDVDGVSVSNRTTARTPSATPSGGIWKSVLGATGGFGCERETFYRETVRDEKGWRLDFGMDEPVIFGIGIDVAHRKLMEDRWAGRDMDLDAAAEAGLSKARGRRTKVRWADTDWATLYDRLHLAVEKLSGAWPNRVDGKGVPQPEPDGTPAGPPISWLDAPAGVTVEAQLKLHAPDVVGGRGITGQPDYCYRDTDTGLFLAWADVKALGKSGSYPAKWAAGEAVTYDYLLTVANGGQLPDWHVYLEYRRVMKPYWAVIVAPVADSVVSLARSYMARWGRALDLNDPDILSFRPQSCAKCEFRLPMPGLGFDGCAIGEAVVGVIPLAEDTDG